MDADITLEEIERLTDEYAPGWAAAHARRIIWLVEQIAEGEPYDEIVIRYAAYLHDWGIFQRYAVPGVTHALRSRQVAESEILPRTTLSPEQQAKTLEAIEVHDVRNRNPIHSREALLLREADALDGLGTIGTAREFTWGPSDLRRVAWRTRTRREGAVDEFTIPAARRLAEIRMARMEQILAWLEEESGGNL